MLVDFGRAIDLTTATREGVDPLDGKLFGDATGNGMACVAIRMNRGWSFDIDTFGICASAHVLLFGSHIDMEMDRNKRWKIRKALRRYWHKDLWSEFFDLLLNDSIASRPGSLRQFRKKIEDYLKTKNKELAYLLKHQSRIIPKKRLD
jgi:checkpoint serine/threonine-protein kinase